MVVEISVGEVISIEKVSTVFPATPTERRTMFLTSCDLVCRSYPYINRIFFYDFKDSYRAVVSSLQESLGRTLVPFFPLAGRFSYDEEGRLQIDCSDCGVDFVEAAADLPFSDLQGDGFQYKSLFWKLARRTSLLRSDYLHQPILSIQVTKFLDGGLTLGISLSHAVADAQSFYDFVKCWAENCRGVSMSVPPKHMRGALSVESLFPVEPCFEDISMYMKKRVMGGCNGKPAGGGGGYGGVQEDGEKFLSVVAKEKEEEEKKKQQREEIVKELNMGVVAKVNGVHQGHEKTTRAQAPIMEKQLEEEEHRQPRTDLVQKVFSFTLEMLQRLKTRASSCVEPATKSFTTFESFCAHWWQSLIRARCLPPAQPVFLLIPINCRQRFLNLPKGYFGNSLDGGLVKTTAGELCAAELPVIAGKIHDAITAVTEDSFRQYIREAERKRNAIPHFDRTGLFHVVDSPKYPVYDTDFGWGPPEAVRAEGFRFGAEVQILAGRLGNGSYDMFCALDSDTMYRLEHDAAFLAC